MENKSPIQQTSNNLLYKKNEVVKKIKDNINYIYIVLMILANCIVAVIRIEDGSIIMHYPQTALGWVLWATQIALQTIIGVLILNGFRRQGIKIGHDSISKTYEEYLSLTRTNAENQNPRSLKQYLTGHAAKDSMVKASFYVVLSMFVASVVIGANWNALLSLAGNIIFAIGFGIKALLDAEEFVIKELVIWYEKEISRINKLKEEGEKNDRTI